MGNPGDEDSDRTTRERRLQIGRMVAEAVADRDLAGVDDDLDRALKELGSRLLEGMTAAAT